MGLEIINRLKKEKGLTNAQISEMSGVTLSTLDKITSGVNKNPKLDTLQAIANVLGCSLNDFDDKKEQPAENGELSKREQKLISQIADLPPDEQNLILDLCIALASEYLRHRTIVAKESSTSLSASSR